MKTLLFALLSVHDSPVSPLKCGSECVEAAFDGGFVCVSPGRALSGVRFVPSEANVSQPAMLAAGAG